MSSITASVEWLFDDVIIYFEFMDFKKKNKIENIWQDAYLSGEKKKLENYKGKVLF